MEFGGGAQGGSALLLIFSMILGALTPLPVILKKFDFLICLLWKNDRKAII